MPAHAEHFVSTTAPPYTALAFYYQTAGIPSVICLAPSVFGAGAFGR